MQHWYLRDSSIESHACAISAVLELLLLRSECVCTRTSCDPTLGERLVVFSTRVHLPNVPGNHCESPQQVVHEETERAPSGWVIAVMCGPSCAMSYCQEDAPSERGRKTAGCKTFASGRCHQQLWFTSAGQLLPATLVQLVISAWTAVGNSHTPSLSGSPWQGPYGSACTRCSTASFKLK